MEVGGEGDYIPIATLRLPITWTLAAKVARKIKSKRVTDGNRELKEKYGWEVSTTW